MNNTWAGIIIGFLLCACVVFGVAATTRESLYAQQGPKLTEAIVMVCLDEFNRNRDWHGQDPISTNAMIVALTNKISQIPDLPFDARLR